MGYYTTLKLSVQLNKDAPLDILEKLCNQELFKELMEGELPSIMSVGDTPNIPIDHPFGKTHRWTQIFAVGNIQFNKERKTLKINCEIKEYEEDYSKLIDWLKPFIVSGKAKSRGEDDSDWINLLN